MGRQGLLTIVFFLTTCGHLSAGEPMLSALTAAAGGEIRGVVVRVGASDGKLEQEIASAGKSIVHLLVPPSASPGAARRTLTEAGLYGAASAESWPGKSLPYGDNLVNLLIVDLDELKDAAPRRDEIERVLVPNGKAHLRSGGQWRTVSKAMPGDFDDWRYYLHDPSGNPVSRDRQAGPATTLRWIGGYSALGGNTEGLASYRLADGLAFHHLNWFRKEPVPLLARDAFNGVPLWRVEANRRGSRAEMVAKDGKLFTVLPVGKQDRYAALDVRTGEVLQVYDAVSFADGSGKQVRTIHTGGMIVITNGSETLTALDERTGEVRWTATDRGRPFFPALDAAGKRLFMVFAQPKPGYEVEHWSRWPGVVTEAVVCLDAATGKMLWRNADLKGRHIGQLLVDGDRLVTFHPTGIGAAHWPEKDRDSSLIASLDAASGQLLWQRGYVGDDRQPSFTFVLFARDGRYYLIGNNHAIVYDREGNRVDTISPRTVNNRCQRPSVTTNYLIVGFGMFWDREGRWTFQNVSRSDCATAAVPGYGMLYYNPGSCHCFRRVSGHLAVAATAVPKPVADDQRLQRAERLSARVAEASAPLRSPVEPPQVTALEMEFHRNRVSLRTPRLSDNLLRDEWLHNDALPSWTTPPVAVEGVEYRAATHEHRLEASRDGNLRWTFVAGGRISSPPVVFQGRVYFGCHDGYIYCLSASTGQLSWRFLAAPVDRRAVVYGQLESVSPVFGVTMHEGKVCAAAGRHPELDGGIRLWGLDPSTGAIVWQGALHYPLQWQTERTRTALAGYQNRLLGGVLRSEEGTLRLGYLAIDPTKPPAGDFPRLQYVPAERW